LTDLYLNMPVSEYYGWGVCGKNLLKEFSKKVSVGYISDSFEGAFRDEELDELVKKHKVVLETDVVAPFIHTVSDDFLPATRWMGGINIGYAFFEKDDLSDQLVDNAKRSFNILVGGSRWNENLFKESGINNSTHIPLGVDRSIFQSSNGQRNHTSSFVVFSGGKFEHRKGQDIVIKAVAEVQKKHSDIKLVGSWFNLFNQDTCVKETCETLVHSGLKNFIPIELCSQEDLAKVMQATDIGIFPNRCEGGTNLVLMEYLSCGKPVIARDYRGQADVLGSDYSFLTVGDDDHVLCQTIEYLEHAYQNGRLKEMGEKADKAMDKFTWEKTADQFLSLVAGIMI
jgi:glycosyltransferase involved in cell wall biosynthesis